MPKKMSVSDEIHTIELAVEATWELSRHAEESAEDVARRLHPRIGAVLALVAARLHDFDRVVRGEVDPAMFVARHCAVEVDDEDNEDDQDDREDILLEEWAPEKRRANAEWELRRAEAREREVRRKK